MPNKFRGRRITLALTLSVSAVVGILAASPLSAFGSSPRVSADKTLIVGVPRDFGYLSTLWARNVQPAGYHIEYKFFNDFTTMLEALNAGQIDLTEIGDVGAIQSVVNGAEVRAVAVTQPNSQNCGLLVRKSSKATSLADLKGQSILFLKATNSYIMFLHQIQAAHLPAGDFTINQTPPPASNTAFTSGAAAALYTIDPNMANIEDQTGAKEIATCAQFGVQNLYPYVATTSAIAHKSGAIAALVKAIEQDFTWIHDNPTKQADLLAPKLGFTKAAIETTYKRGASGLQLINSTFYKSENNVISQLVKAAIIPHSITAQKVFLPTFNSAVTAGQGQ